MRSRAINFVEGLRDLSFNACLRLPVAGTIAVPDKKEAGLSAISRPSPDADSSPLDHEPVLAEKSYRFRKAPVLVREDALRKGILIVTFKHRHALLEDDRSPVKALVHEMHGASRYLHPVFHCLALGVQPGERGQKCRVDVDLLPENAWTIPSPTMRI